MFSRPSTFQERGVAVPFTTPMLAQARARFGRSGAVELMLANPSGGRGWYVLAADKVAEAARLTMHDRLLLERLCRLPGLSPATMRGIAREVAASGAAGREAAHAAADAVAHEDRDRRQANLMIMVGLLRRHGHDDLDWRGLDLGDNATQAELKGMLARLAPGFGMTVDRMLVSIDEIASFAVPVGFAERPFVSRAVRTVEALERFATEVRAWAQLEPQERRPGVELIAICAGSTLMRARACLDRLWAAIEATPQLLRQWTVDRAVVVDRLAQPDWLLDGWPYVCASWDQASSEDRSSQRVALARIEGLVPSTPLEGGGEGPSPDERLHHKRWLRSREDLRSPATAALAIGRNEALRAVLA